MVKNGKDWHGLQTTKLATFTLNFLRCTNTLRSSFNEETINFTTREWFAFQWYKSPATLKKLDKNYFAMFVRFIFTHLHGLQECLRTPMWLYSRYERYGHVTLWVYNQTEDMKWSRTIFTAELCTQFYSQVIGWHYSHFSLKLLHLYKVIV